MRLAHFPHDPVRIACHNCERRGRYRLAGLVERFGADARLTDVLHALAKDCPKRDVRAPGNTFCGAHYEGLAAETRKNPPQP